MRSPWSRCCALLARIVLAQLLAQPFVASFCPVGMRPPPCQASPHNLECARRPARVHLTIHAMPTRGLVFTTEESTGRTVCLVSTMHYNPASIVRVVDTVDSLAYDNRLGPVVIELCPSRYLNWKKQDNKLRRVLLTSEMQIAAERAKLAGVDFILGDQPIELLGKRTAQVFRETVRDLASPLGGGWLRCGRDIARASRSVLSLPSSASPGSFLSYLRSRLDLRKLDVPVIAAAPVSIVRYALAWVVDSPLSVVAVRASEFSETQHHMPARRRLMPRGCAFAACFSQRGRRK